MTCGFLDQTILWGQKARPRTPGERKGMLRPSSPRPCRPRRDGKKVNPAEIYADFRLRAFSHSRTALGIPEPPADAPAWGLLMESTTPDGVTSLLALADGTTGTLALVTMAALPMVKTMRRSKNCPWVYPFGRTFAPVDGRHRGIPFHPNPARLSSMCSPTTEFLAPALNRKF